MSKKSSGKRKKRFHIVIMKAPETSYRIVMRKNNAAKKPKLQFKKYCPINRKRLTFTE